MSLASRLRADRRGVTVVEFALIAPVMCLMMMGLGDLLYQMYAKELLEGSIQKAARDSAIQGGAQQTAEIDNDVLEIMSAIMPRPTASCAASPAAGTFCSTRKSYEVFSAAGPEPFNDDNNNGQRNSTECYQDLNKNGSWDVSPGPGTAGQGGANDVTLYTIKITYARIFPVPQLFGWNANNTVAAQALLKNQPYATRADPTITWKCS
jgi:hypothetical protein